MGCEMCAPYQTPRACRTRMMFVFHPTCWRTTAELQPFMLNLPYFVRAVCHLDLARSGPGPRSTSASTPSSHRREQSPRTWYGPASSEGRAATMTSSFDTTSPSSLGHRHIIVEAAACLKGAVSPSGHRGGSDISRKREPTTKFVILSIAATLATTATTVAALSTSPPPPTPLPPSLPSPDPARAQGHGQGGGYGRTTFVCRQRSRADALLRSPSHRRCLESSATSWISSSSCNGMPPSHTRISLAVARCTALTFA